MQLPSLLISASLFAGLLGITGASPTPTRNIATIVKRDGAAVVSAVNAISAQITTLNDTVNSYEGGLLGTLTALKIQIESTQLSNDLKSAIKTTEQSSNFTDAESGNVATAFLNLSPNVISTLSNIVSKKSDFETGLLGIGSLTWLVKSDLEQEKEESAELGDAVIAKLTPNYAALAPLINAQIADAFTSAINAYSS